MTTNSTVKVRGIMERPPRNKSLEDCRFCANVRFRMACSIAKCTAARNWPPHFLLSYAKLREGGYGENTVHLFYRKLG